MSPNGHSVLFTLLYNDIWLLCHWSDSLIKINLRSGLRAEDFVVIINIFPLNKEQADKTNQVACNLHYQTSFINLLLCKVCFQSFPFIHVQEIKISPHLTLTKNMKKDVCQHSLITLYI